MRFVEKLLFTFGLTLLSVICQAQTTNETFNNNEALSVIIPMVIILAFDLVILVRVLSVKEEHKRKQYFNYFSLCVCVIQFVSVFLYANEYNFVSLGEVPMFILYALGISGIAILSFLMFIYLLSNISINTYKSRKARIFFALPMVVFIILTIASQWTHWMFYIDEQNKYHPGTFFALQMFGAYFYVALALIFIYFEYRRNDKRNAVRLFRLYMLFIIPSTVGCILQTTVFRGGYSQLGVSLGFVLMYMYIYVEQISESRRLRSIEVINEKLKTANESLTRSLEEQKVQIDEIQALNTELTKTKYKKGETLRILQHIATSYSALYYIDISTGKFIELGKTHLQYVEDLIGDEGDAQDRLDAFVGNIVKPAQREEYSKFVQLSDVREQLKDRRFIAKAYEGVHNGWSEGSFIAGERDEDGYCKWVFWAVRNIDEQKQIELRQQVELERHYAVIRATSQRYFCAYSIRLEKDRFVEVFSKPHITSLIGTEGTASEAMEKAWRSLVIPEDQPLSKDFYDISTWNKHLLYCDIYTCEFRGVQSGWVRGTIFAAKRNEYGKVTQAIYTMEMIHEQKAAEQALEKAKKQADAANQAKTSFLFNMSHDIRTPMNAIIGFTNLLRRHQEEPERRTDYLDKIENSSQVLLSIINNVLEMARIEKGTIEFDEVPTVAEEFNETIQIVFKEMMKNKGLTFNFTSDVQHHNVLVDSTKLREIFYNILSNAYKYTEKGSVTMSLKELPSKREGYALYQTTITDTGMGMSEEFLPHLFEEFSRESNATDNNIEGTGLGMPIVKRLVELMEGTVEVTSKKGVGTTFVVTLPHRITDDIEKKEVSNADINPADFEGKRILLAEDNDLNAEIAFEILGEVGFVVERAENGQECVEMLQKSEAGHFDVILMDIQMPMMNGYEATEVIRKMSDSAKANIPILAMTANAFAEDSRQSIEAGMDGHLSKPINVEELLKCLSKYVS